MARGHNRTGFRIPNTPGSSDASDDTSSIGFLIPADYATEYTYHASMPDVAATGPINVSLNADYTTRIEGPPDMDYAVVSGYAP